jgi:filamentous hemagglutinin family protein
MLALGAHAQIAADGTLGTAVNRNGNDWSITAGTIVGGNLFHSFSAFGIPTSHTATFSGPASITHIIGRVTGGTLSSIDGVLRSTIAGANLYLVNPNGVMFGPNARLDVSGSFHASTASYLKLGTSGRFDAVNPGASVLVTAPPSAFGFAGASAGAITADQAALQVPDGQGLSLIGGALTANGASFVARGGRVDLASVASAGEIALVPAGTLASGVTAYGPIALNSTLVETSSVPGYAPQGISIRGGRLTMTEGSLLLADTAEPGTPQGVTLDLAAELEMNGGAITSRNSGPGQGGAIVVRANGVAMEGSAFIESHTSGSGPGGSLVVESAGPVSISGMTPFRTGLYASTSGPGDAGSLRVSAPSLTVADGGIIHSHAFTGRGADVTIETADLALAGGGRIRSIAFGSGAGGNVAVHATGSVTISGSDSASVESGIEAVSQFSGPAGRIDIQATDITLAGGGQIDATTFYPLNGGAGGVVSLAASGTVDVYGSAPDGTPSRIRASTESDGNAGEIRISAGTVRVRDGGVLESRTEYGGGNAGIVDVRAGVIEFSNGGMADIGTSFTGRGGTLSLTASDSLVVGGANTLLTGRTSGDADGGTILLSAQGIVIDGALVDLTSSGFGNARSGSITIRGGRLTMKNDAKIQLDTFGGGAAGAADLRLSESIHLSSTDRFSPTISSRNYFGDQPGSIVLAAPQVTLDGASIETAAFLNGAAGNITIEGGRIVIKNGAFVFTDTIGSGAGGNISVTATESVSIGQGFGVSGGGLVSSAAFGSTGGSAGSITVVAPVLDLTRAEITSFSGGPGDAGSISIDVGRLSVSRGFGINTSTHGAGAGGTIRITANDIQIRDAYIYSETTGDAIGSGHAGTVTVNAASSLAISGVGGISTDTFGAGDAGTIVVSAPVLSLTNRGATITSEAAPFTSGNAGSVSVTGGRILLSGGAVIGASTFGSGNAGNVVVAATEALGIVGTGQVGQFDTGIASATLGSGDGGSVTVTAPVLNMNGGFIASTSSDTGGNAGNVTVRAGQLNMSNVALIDASTFGVGLGGSVTVQASEGVRITGAGPRLVDVFDNGHPVLLDTAIQSATYGPTPAGTVTVAAPVVTLNGGQIRSSSEGTGNAGNIVLEGLQALNIVNGGQITTQATIADGGNIIIAARDLAYLRDSRITTSVGTGEGSGGNITIDPTFVVLDNSQIIANAFGGNGGNITIVSEFFLKDPPSLVQASSQFGLQGEIHVTAPSVDVSTGLTVLSHSFFDASLLLRESCAARASRAASSFAGVGRGGLPASPGQMGFGSYAALPGVEPAARNEPLRLAAVPALHCRP